MSLAAVARHDPLVARGSRLAAAVVLVGAVTPAFGSLLEVTGSSFGAPVFRSALLYAWLTVSAVYPMVALASTVGAVAGERETGTLRMVGGLPTTRATLFAGKVPPDLKTEWNDLHERLDAISKLNDNGPVAKNEDFAEEVVRFAVENQDELARRLGTGTLPD